MSDDQTFLASAYLDGDATPEERAQVDGDPTALAEVERLRQVRAVLRQTDSALISTRERHLATALEVWDRLPTSEFSDNATPVGTQSAAAVGQASITSPTSLGARRQRRGVRGLLALAAGLVVIVGGGIVARGFISSNNTNDSIASEAHDQGLSLQAEREMEAADETFNDAGATELRTADVPPASEADTLIGGESAGPPDEDLEVLSNAEELADFANDLNRITLHSDMNGVEEVVAKQTAQSDAPADDNVQAAPADTLPLQFPLCGLVTRIVGPARWDAPGLFDKPVIVGIDDITGEAVAYQADGCTVIARTPPLP
ncbi:anti-sigma factor family protein [uncultured Ilumatobacter sp.]|jgi:hypothetical protein|uniref:anti-sigma factor family protein n=1 Tax=uncultured Ilumatobacter sp. TaxID=879968 RepID=UPI00374FDA5D